MIGQRDCKKVQCLLLVAVGQCLTMLFICHCPYPGSCILSIFTDKLFFLLLRNAHHSAALSLKLLYNNCATIPLQHRKTELIQNIFRKHPE